METLKNVIERLSLNGKEVSGALVDISYSADTACHCGACDDGGYCICDDATINAQRRYDSAFKIADID